MRDLVDITTATSPGVRMATRVLLALAVSFSTAATAAIVLNQQAMDRAETALWTVAGPPCQRSAPVALESLAVGEDPGALTFEQAQGAFLHGGVVCSVIDRDHGRLTHPFTVCQFGSPYAIQLETPPRRGVLQAARAPCDDLVAGRYSALRAGRKLPDGAFR